MISKEELFKNINNDISWLPQHTIFLTIAGSVASGLNTPESDIDYRGIATLPKEYLFGFNKHFEDLTISAPEPDTVIFSIQKFFKLASAGNPNCLEFIFTEEEDLIYVDELGQMIVDNRDHFLSKQLKERYIGYAKAQAHRISGHRRWLLSKMDHCVTREELGLPEKPMIEKNNFDAVKALIRRKLESWNPDFEPFTDSQKIYLQGKVSDILTEMEITSDEKWLAAARIIGLDDNLIRVIKQEKEYENKVEDWKNYLRWKTNRNPKRAANEEKFEYDLKHASTLVKLLKQGKEILLTGKVNVKRREDREELMAIKTGAWTYDQLIDYADKVQEECKEAYKVSKLPNQPNIKLLDNLCIEISQKALEK